MSFGSVDGGDAHLTLSTRNETRKGLQQAERDLEAFARRVQQRGRTLSLFGGAAFGGGLALLAPLRGAVKEAGNFEETLNRFRATFGDLSGDVQNFAQQFGDAANRFEGDILNALSSYQAFFQGLEIADAEAANLSKSVLRLAEDLGSINNIDSAEAQGRFLSFLAGSNEATERFGVSARAAALDQEFLRKGINVTTRTASEQQKVLARLSIAYRALSRQGAVGDAIRTANSFVNSERGVEKGLKEVRKELGQANIAFQTGWNVNVIAALRLTREWVQENQGLVRTYSQVAGSIAAGGAVIAAAGGGLIAAGGAMRLLASAASTAISPVTGIAAAGKVTGGIFASLAGILSTPFVLLGTTALTSLSAIGNVSRAAGALVSTIGAMPAALIAAAAAMAILSLRGRSLASIKDELSDVVTLLNLGAGATVQILEAANALVGPFREIARFVQAIAAGLVRIAQGTNPGELADELTNRVQRGDFGNAARFSPFPQVPGIDPLIRGADAFFRFRRDTVASDEADVKATVGNVVNAAKEAFDEFDSSEFGDEVKTTLELVKQAASQALPGIKAQLEDAFGVGKDFAGEFGFDFDDMVAKGKEKLAELTNEIDNVKQGLKGEGADFGIEFDPTSFQKQIDDTLKTLQSKTAEQGKKLRQGSEGFQGLFGGGNTGFDQLINPNKGGGIVQAVKEVVDAVKKGNEKIDQVREEVAKKPQLVVG